MNWLITGGCGFIGTNLQRSIDSNKILYNSIFLDKQPHFAIIA